MSTRRTLTMAMLAWLSLLLAGETSAMANGSKATRVRYGAEVRIGDTADTVCRFTVELEPLLFRLATVGDRYAVARVTIRNLGERKLVLSLAGDRMALLLTTGERPVILDLGAHDPAAWGSLPAELRSAVAYPQSVEAREEESVFVFVPVADAAARPQGFRYAIASLPAGPVTIPDMTPAKRH
jgi:hypothetical protein